LINYPTIHQTLQVTVGAEEIFSAYIEGPASIRLDRDATYKLIGTEEINQEVNFTINNTKLAKVMSQ